MLAAPTLGPRAAATSAGKQMVPILNHYKVAAACVGNHDFDYGIDNFK